MPSPSEGLQKRRNHATNHEERGIGAEKPHQHPFFSTLLGFVPGKGYDAVFPFIRLPHLAPNLNGDWVQFGSPDLEPNRLYYGDNLQVLRTLPSNYIDLIYIYPPFFSGAEYNVIWGDTNEVRTFSDIWDGGLPTYLIWLNASVVYLTLR